MLKPCFDVELSLAGLLCSCRDSDCFINELRLWFWLDLKSSNYEPYEYDAYTYRLYKLVIVDSHQYFLYTYPNLYRVLSYSSISTCPPSAGSIPQLDVAGDWPSANAAVPESHLSPVQCEQSLYPRPQIQSVQESKAFL